MPKQKGRQATPAYYGEFTKHNMLYMKDRATKHDMLYIKDRALKGDRK